MDPEKAGVGEGTDITMAPSLVPSNDTKTSIDLHNADEALEFLTNHAQAAEVRGWFSFLVGLDFPLSSKTWERASFERYLEPSSNNLVL